MNLEQRAIEYRSAHNYSLPQRPSGACQPSCDLSELVELLYNPTDTEHGEGLVWIISRKESGSIIPVTTIPTTRLAEFTSASLYCIPSRDYYLTKACYRSPASRRTENVYAYDYVAVELDCHSASMSVSQIKDRAGAIVDILRIGPVADGLIPDPNLAIFSGRGIHIVWLIDRIYAKDTDAVRAVANTYATVIGNELSYFPCFNDFEIDWGYCNNPSGLIRLPGTTNTANGAQVTYEVYHTTRMAIPVNAPKKMPMSSSSQIIDVSSASRTGHARMRAIRTLVELRGNLCMGARDIITLIYYCAALMAGYSSDASEKLALELNSCFCCPRSEAEVICSLASARKKKYKYSDRTIITILDISSDELAAIGWHAITGKHAKRDAQRAAAREAKIAEVNQLRNEGKSISEISRITGHSRSSIRKWIAAPIPTGEITEDERKNAASDDSAAISEPVVQDYIVASGNSVFYSKSKMGGQIWAQYILPLLISPFDPIDPIGHSPP